MPHLPPWPRCPAGVGSEVVGACGMAGLRDRGPPTRRGHCVAQSARVTARQGVPADRHSRCLVRNPGHPHGVGIRTSERPAQTPATVTPCQTRGVCTVCVACCAGCISTAGLRSAVSRDQSEAVDQTPGALGVGSVPPLWPDALRRMSSPSALGSSASMGIARAEPASPKIRQSLGP